MCANILTVPSEPGMDLAGPPPYFCRDRDIPTYFCRACVGVCERPGATAFPLKKCLRSPYWKRLDPPLANSDRYEIAKQHCLFLYQNKGSIIHWNVQCSICHHERCEVELINRNEWLQRLIGNKTWVRVIKKWNLRHTSHKPQIFGALLVLDRPFYSSPFSFYKALIALCLRSCFKKKARFVKSCFY